MAKKKTAKKTVKKTASKKTVSKKTVKPLTLNDIYNEVASRADTEGLQINVAETKRVLACFFDILEDYPPADAFDFIAKGLKRAGMRRR